MTDMVEEFDTQYSLNENTEDMLMGSQSPSALEQIPLSLELNSLHHSGEDAYYCSVSWKERGLMIHSCALNSWWKAGIIS